MSFVEEIEKKCVTLFNSYCNDSNIKESLAALIVHMKTSPESKYMDIDDINLKDACQMYRDIGIIMHINFNIMISDGKKQNMRETNLLEMFNTIKTNHCHTMKVKSHTYICEYHKESLFSHLHLASLMTLIQVSKNSEMVYKEKLLIVLTALLHDIGKFESYQPITIDAGRKLLGFAFHGEMGSGIIQQMYNMKFEKYFSKEEWEMMARTVCVHMCGYTEVDQESISAKYKWSLLRLENQSVRNCLKYLSY